MATNYCVNEFIFDEQDTDTMKVRVDKKISLLYDFHILLKELRDKDNREDIVREWLSTYTNKTALNNAVHDIIVGNCTLNEVLKRKGYI